MATFTEENEQLLKNGVDLILSQWPLLMGVMQTSWGEYDRKKLKLLTKLMDCTQYDFSKLPYKEVRSIFILELVEYILGIALLSRG